MMIGSEEATFLSQAVPPSTQPEDGGMVIVENRIVEMLQAGGVPVSADDHLFLHDALRLLGDSPRGLAIQANTSNVRTLLCGVAWKTVEGLYELEQIDQDELDGARRLVTLLDAQLCALTTSKFHKTLPLNSSSISRQPLLSSPCFVFIANWHLPRITLPSGGLAFGNCSRTTSGNNAGELSLSAFLTRLRHFTRSAEPDQIPVSLFSLSEGERDRSHSTSSHSLVRCNLLRKPWQITRLWCVVHWG